MAKIAPADLFNNYNFDGTNIMIPATDVPGLTAAEADPVTGNGAELARLLMETIYGKLEALPANNRPTQMTWSKPVPSGTAADVFRQNYNFGFNVTTDPTILNVAEEPT